MINEWKKGVEGKWTSVQEEWSVEKDHLRRARDEWELKTSSRRRTKSPSQITMPPVNTDSDEDELMISPGYTSRCGHTLVAGTASVVHSTIVLPLSKI